MTERVSNEYKWGSKEARERVRKLWEVYRKEVGLSGEALLEMLEREITLEKAIKSLEGVADIKSRLIEDFNERHGVGVKKNSDS